MKRALTILALFCLLASAMSPASVTRQQLDTTPPAEPVRLVFVHHSTGGNWLADPAGNELGGDLGRALMENNYYVSATNYGWGPDSIGDATDIPNWLDWFTGERSSIYLEALYGEDGQNFGDFGSWPRLDDAPSGENTIILFKSCFPNSDLEGRPDDAPSADGWLSVGHAKFVYNEILKYFATRPDKLFVVITAPPLTSGSNAKNARAFNNWLVNDWLDENNYTLNNVAVFDFYNVLTGPDNHHRIVNGQVEHTYVEGRNTEHYPSGDDHPSRAGNSKATEEFVPMLNAFYNAWVATAGDAIPQETVQTEASPAETEQAAAETELAVPAQNGEFSEGFENGSADWEAFYDVMGGSTLECAASNGNAASGGNALRVDFDVKADGWATCGQTFAAVQDWSAYDGLSFMGWVEADGVPIHVDLYGGSTENRESYYYELTGVGGGWAEVQVPWESFKRVDWEENAGQPFSKTNSVAGLAFGVPSQGQGTFWVDDIRLLGSMAVVEEEPAATAPAEEEAAPAKRSFPFCGGAAALPLGAFGLMLWKKRKFRK